MLGKLGLLRLLHKIACRRIAEEKSCTQYFVDNGVRAYFGLTCAGFHLWREFPSEDEGRFITAPIPAKEIKVDKYLLKGKGTLPFDEFLMSTITARRLEYYWDLVDNAKYEFADPPIPIRWDNTVYLWAGSNGSYLLEDCNTVYVPKGWPPPEDGDVYVFNFPHGESIMHGEYAFAKLENDNKTIPVVLAIRRKDGLRGVIAAWKVNNEKLCNDIKICAYDCEYSFHRQGAHFKRTGEEMNIKNIPKVEDVGKPVIPAIPTMPPTAAVEKAPILEPETTVAVTAPVAAEKPIAPETVGMPEVKELPLAEQMDLCVKDAEMVRLVSSELLKKLKPLLKGVAKLERSAGDSAELRDLRAKVKNLESENATLRAMVKQFAEKL